MQEKKGLLKKNPNLQRNVFSASSVFDGKERLNEWLQTVMPEAALGKLLSLFLEVEPLACIASIDWQMCLCASKKTSRRYRKPWSVEQMVMQIVNLQSACAFKLQE